MYIYDQKGCGMYAVCVCTCVLGRPSDFLFVTCKCVHTLMYVFHGRTPQIPNDIYT